MATSTVNQVLTGFDVTVSIDQVAVGRAQAFDVEIKQGNDFVFQQGTRRPVEIKEKKFEISGTIKRMFINTDLVKKMLGNTNTYANVTPYFDMQGYFKNESDGSVKTITIQKAKFDGWKISTALEASIEEDLGFKALNVVIGE